MTAHPETFTVAPPLCFPATDPSCPQRTGLVLVPDGERLPVVAWLGPLPHAAGDGFAAGVAAAAGPHTGTPLLIEHSRGPYTRPGLRGHRLGDQPTAGRDWSTAFRVTAIDVAAERLRIRAEDPVAELALDTELEALPGGALRARHILANHGTTAYLVDGLEVTVPLADTATELLDFTGRHEAERTPQRHPLRDGLWLREGRRGTPGHDAPTLLAAGAAGFGTTTGEVAAVHVAWSGNCVYRAERDPARPATLGGGELLLPGELVLEPGESYAMPWVFAAAASDGLDGIATALHVWQRSLSAHPKPQPVVLNVWEAVYFQHDPAELARLAELAASVGVERFVLDDGWFRHRRDDRSGLGDWQVDRDVWPDGLAPLIDQVHALGMEFGLWIEPEMVNPDSDLYRAHPDWVLATGDRLPRLERHQLVLDLANPQVWRHLYGQFDALLTDHAIDFIKWDHNRDLHEAGGSVRSGAPAAHAHTLGYYRLLDALRTGHPSTAWESCAGGGGRVDLAVVERVQRFWTSDNTDALARQNIQRWTGQLVAPEYLGAHISAPVSHQTGRNISLDFRAATALFGSFGIEWDLTTATAEDLHRLAEWTARYKQLRPLLHTGRVVRPEPDDPAVLLHGVIAADRRSALIAHVQLDESAHNRGVSVRVPGLEPGLNYALRWAGPVDEGVVSRASALDPIGPTAGREVPGDVLAAVGVWIPRRRPQTMLLIELQATTA